MARSAHEGILRRQSARESAARTYARALPIVPVRARGLTIEGADGRRYLDCLSGAGTLALGHNHPVVLEADPQGPRLGRTPARPRPRDARQGRLHHRAVPHPAARTRRPRADTVLRAGRHGRGGGRASSWSGPATGRSGMLAFDRRLPRDDRRGPLDASGGATDVRVARLPYPQDYRCPFGVGGARGAELAARWTESLLDDPKSGVPRPAGMILEPVQGEGGVIPAPDDWMRRMRQITAAPLHPADRRRGPDGRRPHRRLLGGRTTAASSPT